MEIEAPVLLRFSKASGRSAVERSASGGDGGAHLLGAVPPGWLRLATDPSSVKTAWTSAAITGANV
jgi:hypothetical protein